VPCVACYIVLNGGHLPFLWFSRWVTILCSLTRIRDRDYEQITEKPEKTLADLARQAEEADRRDRKARERQYGYGGNTITGAARFTTTRRPAMSADYLAAGYDQEEDDEGEVGYDEPRARAADRTKESKSKAVGKKKPAVMADYLEYDEDEGSEAEEEEEEEEEEDEEVRPCRW
jgi:TATA-binding protein-associated factor Taf7